MNKKKGGKGNRKCICGGGVAILNKVVREDIFGSFLFTVWDSFFICISNEFFRAET